MNFQIPGQRQGKIAVPQRGTPSAPPVNASVNDPNATYASLEMQIGHERDSQKMKWFYIYTLSGSVVGGNGITPFSITIEQGTDFLCDFITGSAFSFNPTTNSSFPIPATSNGQAVAAWAARGLTTKITDTRAGRTLTSGFLPFELFCTPGYGLSFIKPFPFRYTMLRNSKIQFDITNLDNSSQAHYFNIALIGNKYLSDVVVD
jgi:hypothetical protein